MINKQAIKQFTSKVEPLRAIWIKLNRFRLIFLLRFNPKIAANQPYKSIFKKDIDWNNPVDLIEKIQWLQLYTDTSLWTLCADKYLVRDYVKESGCENNLPQIYGKWNKGNEIDWSKLPKSFVLKANHSCGEVILVKDKSKLNIDQTIVELNKWMKTVYGYHSAQIHYMRIKPCIIAEELLHQSADDSLISPKSLIDYKVWCFHGKPENIWIAYNRDHKEGVDMTLYDINWKKTPEFLVSSDYFTYNNQDIPKPLCFQEMIDIAAKISKPFPQVRVDFYIINDKPIIGELTFTTGFGFFSEEYYKYLGSRIDLSKVKKLPKINTL